MRNRVILAAMDQSLSITWVLEGGLPNMYLIVQDNYSSPAQIFNVPLEFIDFGLLVGSAQATGDYWMVTASPDNPRFQVESAIFVRHREGKIYWDLVYEHYEPFLNIELEEEADDYEENIITFVFDAFQYVSALYQACQLCQHLQPTTFSLLASEHTIEPAIETIAANEAAASVDTVASQDVAAQDTQANADIESDAESDTALAALLTPHQRSTHLHPIFQMAQHAPRLSLLWQKYGQLNNMVQNGQATLHADYYAQETEKQWLQELLDTLDEAHRDNMMDNIDAYLESLPEDILVHLENNREQLEAALTQRWEMLVNSLTEEEADALEKDEIATRFPNSLKLRLMHEFLEGNPSVLLGNGRSHPAVSDAEKVVDLQHWKRSRPSEPKQS